MLRPIALLTDFGYQDAYAGVMKAVIHARLPGAVIFDLTHGVPAQSARNGALQLLSAAPFAPENTVFVAVVDPGVGSERRPIILRSGERLFVGPDNGLLWPAAAHFGEPEAWAADYAEFHLPSVGSTFHGRDVFAPVSAALAGGVDPERVGTPISNPTRLELPQPQYDGDLLRGEVLLIDGFGNAVTNLRPKDLDDPPIEGARFGVRGVEVTGPSACYASVEPGDSVILVGSLGYYEVAVRDGSAASALGLREGDPITARVG